MSLSITKQYTPSSNQVLDNTAYNTDIAALFNTFTGLENQALSLGGLTITPTSNSTTTFKITQSDTTTIFAVDTTNSKIVDTSALGIESTYGLFHDRGNPGAVDKNSWTTDGNWYDWDISSIVPANTKTVVLRIRIKDDATGSTISFRTNGNSNEINISSIATQVTNLDMYQDCIVSCDTSRIIEYKATNTTFTTINATVGGWFK